MSAFDAPAGQA
jgi:hypothetical protein